MWKAGGIPFYKDANGEIHVALFISNNPHYGGSDPQIAKGTPEPGLIPWTLAIKECSEELGLDESDLVLSKNFLSSKNKFPGQEEDYDFFVFGFDVGERLELGVGDEGHGVWMTLEQSFWKIRTTQLIELRAFANKVREYYGL